MSNLSEIVALRTNLSGAPVEHLQRLLASWSLLADLSFSDLVIVTPTTAQLDEPQYVIAGHVRPNNHETAIFDDIVGGTVPRDLAQQLTAAWHADKVTESTVHVDWADAPLTAWIVPITFGGEVIAALVRLHVDVPGAMTVYSTSYLDIFRRFCAMVMESSFPFREADVAGPGLPRVGDGLLLLDSRGVVQFGSPNAISALHRLGLFASPFGRPLRQLGLRVRAVERAVEFGLPTMEEVERGTDVAIVVNCIPLLQHHVATGVLLLLRDVSDIRYLNRMVLNKDSAIREVHHRVKNNLQTISSLLRLQSRRSDEDATRMALLEAERRIRSIAVVHEVLSREPGGVVHFDEIVSQIVALVHDTNVSGFDVDVIVDGSLGMLATDIATPLAIVVAELLTNAMEHAFTDGSVNDVRWVTLRLTHTDTEASVVVRDNGKGFDDRFTIEIPRSLGLSIVRDLVRSQLRGSIEMRNNPAELGGGAVAEITVPLTATA